MTGGRLQKNNMKSKLIAGISLAGALLLWAACLVPTVTLTTGCSTVSTNSPPTTNDPVINATAVILRSAARDGALYAIQTDATTKPYFTLAAASLSTFVTGKDYSPGAFQAALLNVGSGQLTNVWVQIGIGTVIDLYQLYFGQFVKNSVDGNAIAVAFITAIQDGFNEALGNPVTAGRVYYRSDRLHLSPHKGSAILPRPIR